MAANSFFQTPSQTLRRARRAIRRKFFSYLAAGLGLVAGLAWNDASKALIDYVIPNTGSTVVAKLLYAAAVTVVVGLILFSVEKSPEQDEE